MLAQMFKLGLLLGFAQSVFATEYEQYILAPDSRNIHPKSVYNINGTVVGAESIASSSIGSAKFQGISAVTYDFGRNIGGLVTVVVGNATDSGQAYSVSYTESSLWIGPNCDATEDSGVDEALLFSATPGSHSVDRIHERGGFRYLSITHNGTGTLEVTQISVHFTPQPHVAEDQLKNYTGFFHCDDELLNRIWYAGAYTNQLCTIDPNYGDSLNFRNITSSIPGDTVAPLPWHLDYQIANSSSVIVDGAKRDRLIWPGDIHAFAGTVALSTYDMASLANSIDNLFSLQNETGMLPYAGVPFTVKYSATYHLYNLLSVADYYKYTNDLAFVAGKWAGFKKGLQFSINFIDSTELMNVTSSSDWLRFGMGGHNIEANSILYYTLQQGIILADAMNDTSVVKSWSNYSSGIKSAANRLLWNSTAGLFNDNQTTTLAPQDGNTWAIISGLVQNDTQASAISSNLIKRWGPYGPPAVEADYAVSPFISGFELEAHMLAGNTSAALALLRLEWGFMMDDPRMTNSTFIEGYSFDGALHYAPYTNDPRVSHAHGWATGPTSFMTTYIAGVQLLSAGGRTWKIAPRLGDLSSVHAGFKTTLGSFAAQTNTTDDGNLSVDFSTPLGTLGQLSIPYPKVDGTLALTNANGVCETIKIDVVDTKAITGNIEIHGIEGGDWRLRFTTS